MILGNSFMNSHNPITVILKALFFLFIIASCNPIVKDKHILKNIELKNYSGLKDELYSKILNYQKEYPIPVLNERDSERFLPIYLVYFHSEKSDTFVRIIRSSGGVSFPKEFRLFGIYNDSNLYPTVIWDTENLLSARFLDTIKTDTLSLLKFLPAEDKDYEEAFPPIFTYKVLDNSLILFKIDTVWNTWR